MSIGCFLGLRAAWPQGPQAEGLLQALGRALLQHELPAYREPSPLPNPYLDGAFGRSALDHHGSAALAELVLMARGRRLPVFQLSLLAVANEGAMYLPADFDDRLRISWRERALSPGISLGVGSAPQLLEELRGLAHLLGIPLRNGKLPDGTAERINDFLPLYAGDRSETLEDARTAWLMLHEAALLAGQYRTAVVLI